ncbi:MAG: sigma-54-dependent Fis family transcriptional regulator [Immundisolibacter sp.]|uniref:sigma-54-dependent transcriptional regulator n=1 Tax=Immundisolibacter sp. TaxID=1934948 RepID=UPI0019A2A684|nr:sigma-54 dependent transcriptional regulator [Immundisolibacter sp.]MBC7161553.1 sigma-54-dependent Fis family transcriptional regulator [Immundisolibacter sp.]
MTHAAVMVVEDDPALREALCDTLDLAGYRSLPAADGQAALALLERERPALVVSDVQMQPMDGNALLHALRRQRPDLPVVLMTAFGTIRSAVQAVRDGAVEYLAKPFEPATLVSLIGQLLPRQGDSGDEPVAEDPRSRELLALAARVAHSEVSVLLTGESGTGKEVLARYIHRHSARRGGPFVAINCAAIPENMLEAVLFGYEKGAFTGATGAHAGKFEQAHGGSLLLDEISEMPIGLQAKLLRVLQEREVERLGGKQAIALDVRVLATSNRDLAAEVAAGRFREDLYYRLAVFPLHIPPLRERPADILPLARRLLARHWRRPTPAPVLADAAASALVGYPWPGNVRELDNMIQRALILADAGAIEAAHLVGGPAALADGQAALANEPTAVGDLDRDLRSREAQLILGALRASGGRRAQAAAQLGISERTLRYKLSQLREAGFEVPAAGAARDED